MLRAPWKVVTAGRLLTAGVVLLAVAVGLWVIPSRDYIFLPDKAHPVAPLVTVAGGHDPTDGGGIYFVDVVVRKASLLERLLGGLHDGADLHPPSQVVTPGVSGRQQQAVDAAEMRTSQQVAAAVALRSLGHKVSAVDDGALVSAVQSGLPAAGKLVPTDVIVAVDGVHVTSPAGVSHQMAGKTPGALVTFTVHRGGTTRTIRVSTVAGQGDAAKRAIVGVFLDQSERISLPLHVAIDVNGVGGPSAGLAFALDVLEELGRNVDHGRRIAATGELFLNGAVGPIGGIKQKTIGAREAGVDAFLVPAGENARDARKYARGLRIIPVKSFQQALRALATLPVKE
jgi:PDZ domain-containing protein